MKRSGAVAKAVLSWVLCLVTPALACASNAPESKVVPVLKVQMDGPRLRVYGQQLLENSEYKVFFGVEDADYLFEPRIIDYNASRIKLLLPFQPISGRYKFKIGLTESDPAVDIVLVVDDTRIIVDAKTKGSADALLVVTDCQQDQEKCPEDASDDSSAFCGMAADFDPYQGSQAITVSNTQELRLDDNYTIEARIFLREYVRGGIIVDKYSGTGRGREYRLSVGKDGLLRGWFSIDGTLHNSIKLYSDYPVPTNRWIHVASTNERGAIRLFIDGELAAEKRVAARPAQLGYQNVAIGGNNCCSGYYEVLNGLVDEVRISDTTRYRSAFEPPDQEFEPDDNTLLLMHFSDAGKNDGLIGGNAPLSNFNTVRSCEST